MRSRLAAARRVAGALRRTGRRFRSHLRPQLPLAVGATAALLIETLARIAEPWPIKVVLDDVLLEDGAAGGSGLGSIEPATLLILCALAVLLFAAVRAGASYLSTVGLALAGSRVVAGVRGEVFAHVQRLSLRYHSGARLGDLVTRLTYDIGKLQEVAITAALPLAANLLTLAGMLAVMLWIDWVLTLAALAAVPLFALPLVRRGSRIRGVARAQRRREGALAAGAAEALGAIRVVQALGLEERVDRAFAADNRRSLTEGVRAKRLAAGLERGVDLMVGVAGALVLYVGARRVQAGAMTPGDLVVFLLYLKTAFKPMRDMAKYAGRLAQAAASGERILELLDTAPDIRDRPGAVAAGPIRGAVRLDGVELRYTAGGRPALAGVGFEVDPGMHVGLAGPSGGGKSSLLAVLPRLYDVDAGAVLVDGRDVRDYTVASLRAQFATVLQESVLFRASVRENIAMGSADVSDEAVEQAARAAGAHAFVSELPDGYDTVLGERGATLSGGQRQRVAIARAMVRHAPVILLDEPTTGLDEHSERALREALRALCAGRTTFTAAHDLRLMRAADLILYVDDGRIRERGTHAELLAAGGSYAATWERQRADRAAAGGRGTAEVAR